MVNRRRQERRLSTSFKTKDGMTWQFEAQNLSASIYLGLAVFAGLVAVILAFISFRNAVSCF